MSVPEEWFAFGEAVADRYALVSEVGRGGMAVVLLARDLRHRRDVAIKLFRPAVSAAMAAERFAREIEVAARLNHPHIVPLFDSGAAADFLYYVMPLVRGESLRQRLDRDGPLDVANALRIMADVCGALDYAHRDGIVHRDIKPENILLSEGHALVADFGIAFALDHAAGDRLTGTGLALGTPAYMSPEQAGGDHIIDARSDQYSMACVLYEMLTGQTPFQGPTGLAFLTQHMTQRPPRVTSLRSDIPLRVDRAIARALEKQPDERFDSINDLSESLTKGTASETLEVQQDWVLVLDFLNVTGDASVQWLASGIAETIGVDLGRVDTIRLVRRERLQRALVERGRPVASEADAIEVARALGVQWVVWGTYQAASDRIRITPRLGDVARGTIAASHKLDGALSEVFALQDRIVAQVLESLQVSLSASARAEIAKPATKSLSAYELFARARQLQNRLTPTAMVESIALLQDAVAADPEFALAHSGLGYAFAFRFIGSSNPADLAEALVHLERATTLDDGLGEAYAWQTYVLTLSGRTDDAVHAGERAVALEPDFYSAHYFLALALRSGAVPRDELLRRRERAVRALFQAVRAEPGSQSTYQVLADLYITNGQYEDAELPARKALDIESGVGRSGIHFIGALTIAGTVAAHLLDLARARDCFTRAASNYATSSHLYAQVMAAQAHRGLGDVARHQGEFYEALMEANHAIRICREHPTQVGTGFTLIRAHALAAMANHALGIPRAAREELATAERLLATREGYAFLPLIGANESLAAVDCARAHALAGHTEAAMEHLAFAVRCGWNEYPQLAEAAEFERLRHLDAFQQLLSDCGSRPLYPAPGPRCEGTP